MANLSPDGAALVKAHVQDWSGTDEQLADSLNAPSIPNPTPQPQVLQKLTTGGMLQQLSLASQQKVVSYPNLQGIITDIGNQDRGAVAVWIQALELIGAVSPQEAGALMGDLSATVPDPSWQAQISWAQANLGRAVDVQDIAIAREA